MDWWPGILWPIGVLVVVLVWAIRYELPRQSAESRRIDAMEARNAQAQRELDHRRWQRKQEHAAHMRKFRDQLRAEGRDQEADAVEQDVQRDLAQKEWP